MFVVDPTFAASGAPRLAYLHDALMSLDASIRTRSDSRVAHRAWRSGRDDPATRRSVRRRRGLRQPRLLAVRSTRATLRCADALRAAGRGAARASGRRTPSIPAASARTTARRTRCSRRSRRSGDGSASTAPFDEPRRRRSGGSPEGGRLAAHEPLFDRPDPDVRTRRPSARMRLTPDGRSFLDAASAADGTLRSGVDAYNDLRDRRHSRAPAVCRPTSSGASIHPRTLLADLDLSGAERRRPDGLLERVGMARLLRRRAVPAARTRRGRTSTRSTTRCRSTPTPAARAASTGGRGDDRIRHRRRRDAPAGWRPGGCTTACG